MDIAQIQMVESPKVLNYYRKIKRLTQMVSVIPELQSEYEAQGFTVTDVLKTKIHLERDWPAEVELENRIYCCMYELGIKWHAPQTRVNIVGTSGEEKEVDVLAATENVILVFESKSFRVGGGNLKSSEIDELFIRCELIRKSIGRNRGEKKKVHGIMVTRNSSHAVRTDDYAKTKSITVLRSEDIDLYRNLKTSVGAHAKYMFLSRLLSGKSIPGLKLEVPAILSRVGQQVSYSFAAHPEDLLQIGYVAHRTGRPSDCYQRLVNKSKIRKIRSYIDKGGIFPTNIIIAFDDDTRGLRFEPSEDVGSDNRLRIGKLIIPGIYGCAWVVDGQHRLMGYAGHKWANTAYLHVTAYQGLPKSEQAQMFDDINSNQTKVPKNHLAELDAILHDDSTDPLLKARSVASQVLQEIAQSSESCLGHRIITSATPARDLCEIPLGDFLDRIQTRTTAASRLFARKISSGEVSMYGPLWTSSSGRMKKRLRRVINTWFGILSENCPNRWSQGKLGLLSSQRGIAAMMRYLTWAIEAAENIDFDSDDSVRNSLIDVAEPLGKWWESIDDMLLHRMNKYGSAGVPIIVAEASTCLIDSTINEFGGEELTRITQQHLLGDPDLIGRLFRRAELACIKRLRRLLLEIYANDEEALSKGLDPKEIGAVTERWAEGGAEDSKWAYLWFIDIKKAVSKHWENCQSSFEKDGRGKVKGLNWLLDLNKIRNAALHGGGLRAKKVHGVILQDVLDELGRRRFDISGDTSTLGEIN